MKAAGCQAFSRLWISSMEDAAIREGFVDLRPGADYDPLYQSALCRQKADWLIGINASRLFSVLYHRTLNIGRCRRPPWRYWPAGTVRSPVPQEKYHHVRLALEGAEAVSEPIVSPRRTIRLRGTAPVTCPCVSLRRRKGGAQTDDLTTAAGGEPDSATRQANPGLRPIAL